MAPRKPLDVRTLEVCVTAFYSAEKLGPSDKVRMVIEAYEDCKRQERLESRTQTPAKKRRRA